MILGILKETDDRRVALVPQMTAKFEALGIDLMMESGAGDGARLADSAFGDTVKIGSRSQVIDDAEIIISINQPDVATLDQIQKNKYIISSFAPFMDDTIVANLKGRGLHAFSMDMIPRTTLAQGMDVLSSMASIAGYKAVLKAADHLLKYFPMMITAAGSIKPAKVLVIGAGVAGLQAIATARRLGAVVEVFDTRSAVKEEVQSLGARFVEVEGAKEDAGAGGYAVQQTEEYLKRQRELVQEKASQANVVITTAQVRGRKAPVIIPGETVERMQPGAVIVDLAASTGGNCELTQNAKTINHNGVTIIGDSNLAQGMPQDASFLYSNNVLSLLKTFVKEGKIEIDPENEIIASALITLEKTQEHA